jgi:Tol biopolymer transport system component
MYYTLGGETGRDIWVLPLTGERKASPFLETKFNEQDGRFSPDGGWVAYVSDESGRAEVYVITTCTSSGCPFSTFACTNRNR